MGHLIRLLGHLSVHVPSFRAEKLEAGRATSYLPSHPELGPTLERHLNTADAQYCSSICLPPHSLSPPAPPGRLLASQQRLSGALLTPPGGDVCDAHVWRKLSDPAYAKDTLGINKGPHSHTFYSHQVCTRKKVFK